MEGSQEELDRAAARVKSLLPSGEAYRVRVGGRHRQTGASGGGAAGPGACLFPAVAGDQR